MAFDDFSHLRCPVGEAGLFCTIDRPIVDDYHCRAKRSDFGDLGLLPILGSGQVVDEEERLEGPTSSNEIHPRQVRITYD